MFTRLTAETKVWYFRRSYHITQYDLLCSIGRALQSITMYKSTIVCLMVYWELVKYVGLVLLGRRQNGWNISHYIPDGCFYFWNITEFFTFLTDYVPKADCGKDLLKYCSKKSK